MNEFKQSVANALRYWETRRVLYNAVLTAVAAGWVILTWPHFERTVMSFGLNVDGHHDHVEPIGPQNQSGRLVALGPG